MRVANRGGSITLPPDQPVKVTLDVTNTLEVIDGVVASVGVPTGVTATANPQLLPLFPDGVGQVVLELRASPTFPCGSYQLPVELHSSVVSDEMAVEPLDVTVPPVPAGELTVLPAVRSVRHRARYTLVCENTGNVALEVALSASDAEHACVVTFAAPVLAVEPGGSATTEMTVRRRRRLLGGDQSVDVTVLGTSSDLDLETKAVLRHRPLIARGVRVALVLAAIVALWAGVFVVVLEKALSTDPLAKSVPASFYASSPSKSDRAKLKALGGVDLDLASADGSPPAGAVPKTPVVIGVGGTISGTVTAKSTDAGVGRIGVSAWADTPKGEKLVASAATQTNGSYSIAGLLPGSYTVEFDASGYQTVWYPDASSQSAAGSVTVDALATTSKISAVIAGHPGTLTGTVVTGQKPSPPVTVTVEPEQGVSTTPIATVQSNGQGVYTIPDLPAPQTYDLSFSAKGYQVGADSEDVAAGATQIANTVTLTAADGTIAGLVTSAGKPLGGVTVSASADGDVYTTATPTTGAVGSFTLANLPSPATYLITFTKSGYGAETVGEALGPGQILTGLDVKMNGGAGTIIGRVTTADGAPLGGVTITAYSGSTTTTVQSFNSAGSSLGTYDLSGLRTPGTYVLTFSLAGYASQTISVPLGSSGSATGVDATLSPSTGTIEGRVTSGGVGLAGVGISLTNGTTVTSAVSVSQPAGSFSFTGLSAGSYTLTFSLTGYDDDIYSVTLRPGQTVTIRPTMTAES